MIAYSSQCGTCACLTGECQARGIRKPPDPFRLEANDLAWYSLDPPANSWPEEDAVPTEGHAFPVNLAAALPPPGPPPGAPSHARSLGHPNPHRRLWRA